MPNAPILRHQTPNYRQVRHVSTVPGHPVPVLVWYTWQPVPLRASRKDLGA